MLHSNTAVLVVTHNSEIHIKKMAECVNNQTIPPKQFIIVDSGSTNPDYLDTFSAKTRKEKGDIGFAKGNNLALELVNEEIKYVLFLNPDAFLTPSFLENAETFMEQHPECGALTGTVLGYEIEKDQPTDLYDTTGIFQKWYGKWYDRGQGEKYDPKRFNTIEKVPAICAAVMFCRKEALTQVMQKKQVMDESFYMYKEDIDLSLRLQAKGWALYFVPALLAYHCRGWNRKRKQMPHKFRMLSARNELKIHLKQKNVLKITYSLLKYLSVTTKIF
ncbi:MAG: glycosyltransferase family 2 protein [Waddliaceae bacterium]